MKYLQLDLFDKTNHIQKDIRSENKSLLSKIERALKLLRSAAVSSEQPIEICYSGGKDSDVILELARMSGIKYRAIYKNTTIDPPGTITHVKANDVEIITRKSFGQVIRENGFPTFKRRFCCKHLKKYKILDRAVQGIRRTESVKRRLLYKEPTFCRLYGKKQRVEVFLPILYWSDKDVSDFIEMRGIKCHHLYYDENGDFNPKCRLGCLGCPQKSDKGLADFKAYPKLVKYWLRNGEIWWNTHKLVETKKKFKNIYEVFVCNIFFKSYSDFRKAINNMFGEIDCKQFIEQYFGIDL